MSRVALVAGGGTGIGRATALALPASVRTALARTDRPDFDEIEGKMAAGYPLGRLGEPEDVAEAIRSRCSSASRSTVP